MATNGSSLIIILLRGSTERIEYFVTATAQADTIYDVGGEPKRVRTSRIIAGFHRQEYVALIRIPQKGEPVAAILASPFYRFVHVVRIRRFAGQDRASAGGLTGSVKVNVAP